MKVSLWIKNNWPKVAGLIVLAIAVLVVSHVACPAEVLEEAADVELSFLGDSVIVPDDVVADIMTIEDADDAEIVIPGEE